MKIKLNYREVKYTSLFCTPLIYQQYLIVHLDVAKKGLWNSTDFVKFMEMKKSVNLMLHNHKTVTFCNDYYVWRKFEIKTKT